MQNRITHSNDISPNQRNGYVYRRLISQDVAPYNVLHIVVDGTHTARKVIAGIRNYYVITGRGLFTVADVAYRVTAGTLIVINPDEIYSYTGQMELLEFNTPTASGIAHEDV